MTAREVRWGRGALQTGRVGAALRPSPGLRACLRRRKGRAGESTAQTAQGCELTWVACYSLHLVVSKGWGRDSGAPGWA